MSRKSLIELELERIKAWRKYYKNLEYYLKEMLNTARKYDEKARVILFGSYVRGDMKPDSDIDILIVTDIAGNVRDRLKLRLEIASKIGRDTPYEIHIVTPNEYRNWYKRFIDEYREVT